MDYVQGMMQIMKLQTKYTKISRLDWELNLGPSACRAATNHYTTEDVPTLCVQIAPIALLVTDA